MGSWLEDFDADGTVLKNRVIQVELSLISLLKFERCIIGSSSLWPVPFGFVESDRRIILRVRRFVHADFQIGVLDLVEPLDETTTNERPEGI